MTMHVIDPLTLLRAVYALGGSLQIEGDRLILRAPEPLPDALCNAVRQHKPEIMAALGSPVDSILQAVLQDLRPRLPVALEDLRDDQLLQLLRVTLISCWNDAVRQVEEH
jgi:hypothetical protein